MRPRERKMNDERRHESAVASHTGCGVHGIRMTRIFYGFNALRTQGHARCVIIAF